MKTMNNFNQGFQPPGRDLNRRPPEYKVLTTWPWRSMTLFQLVPLFLAERTLEADRPTRKELERKWIL